MNIKSLENIKYDEVSKTYNIQDPSFVNNLSVELFKYEVQMSETMRPDLIMKSIYKNSIDVLEDWDVILYINGIENPLKETTGEEISKVDKSTRKDKKREKFVKGNYQLPPVVTNKPKQPVKVVDGNITIGGF